MTQDSLLDHILPLQPAMQLLAERLLQSTADAEDTVQEVIIDLWQRRSELGHISNLEGYAMQTLRHRCISLLRHKRMSLIDDEEHLPNISDEAIRAEAELIAERSRMLDNMMTHLPEKQREAIRLKYIEECDHEQMQQRLGMSSSAVYTTLSRAVSALKSMVKR